MKKTASTMYLFCKGLFVYDKSLFIDTALRHSLISNSLALIPKKAEKSMKELVDSTHKIARQAGGLYILLVGVAVFGMGYVPAKIFIRNDLAGTANNILSNEFLFRSGILSHLASVTAIAIMVLMLYRLFSPLNKHLSRLMIAPVLLQVPIVFVIECFNIAALMILKGETWMSMNMAQRQELSYFMLRMHGYGIGASQIFWGLWLFPFGILINTSRYIPRFFGVLLIINGIGYVTEGVAFILLHRNDYLIVRQFARLTFVGLPLTMLWFLIKGISKSATLAINKVKNGDEFITTLK